MKAIFDWPYDAQSRAGLQHVTGLRLDNKRSTYSYESRWHHKLVIDCANRVITIEGPEDSRVPWTTFYELCAQVILQKNVTSNIETAKRWFKKLRVIEHASARADRHPTDAGPDDRYHIIKVAEGEIVHDKNHSYTNKRDYLAVMSQLYDRIQSKFKRPI